jgi:hypothetical protein
MKVKLLLRALGHLEPAGLRLFGVGHLAILSADG